MTATRKLPAVLPEYAEQRDTHVVTLHSAAYLRETERARQNRNEAFQRLRKDRQDEDARAAYGRYTRLLIERGEV